MLITLWFIDGKPITLEYDENETVLDLKNKVGIKLLNNKKQLEEINFVYEGHVLANTLLVKNINLNSNIYINFRRSIIHATGFDTLVHNLKTYVNANEFNDQLKKKVDALIFHVKHAEWSKQFKIYILKSTLHALQDKNIIKYKKEIAEFQKNSEYIKYKNSSQQVAKLMIGISGLLILIGIGLMATGIGVGVGTSVTAAGALIGGSGCLGVVGGISFFTHDSASTTRRTLNSLSQEIQSHYNLA